MFVPVSFIPTQLTRVKTEVSFAAEDPWHANRPCTFTLDSYLITLRGVKSVPSRASRKARVFHRALRSDTDGAPRFLPESLIELWLTRQVAIEALPALLKQMEPSLIKSDYKPILRSVSMKIFGIFEAVCCALLVVISVIAVVASHAPFWLAAMVVLAVACVCWVFWYQVYFGMILRRKQQTKWLLERIRLETKKETPRMTTAPNPRETIIHSRKIEEAESPNSFRLAALMDVPEVLEPSMLPRLRKAFPELKWEDHAENWGKIRIWGTTRETPERVVISIVRKESPGPFKVGITVSAQDHPEAVKLLSEFMDRLQRTLSGWSLSNLPKFKTRPPSGITIDQEDVVDLTLPVEPPRIRLVAPNADILVSRTLLEALSAHGKTLDTGNDDESRGASMRGTRARFILEKAGKDLEMQLAPERQAQYLAGELLENGLAQVVLLRTPPLSLRRIKVHYVGNRAAPTAGFGFISYSGADTELGYPVEFLHLSWWVS